MKRASRAPCPMSRFFAFAVGVLGISSLLVLAVGLGCSSSDVEADDEDSGALHKDSSVVDPSEAGSPLDSGPGPLANCSTYCNDVTTHCTGANAQYGSYDDCLRFCAHLPLDADPGTDTPAKAAPTVACRQYWAESPAQTDPGRYCLAAGPFGGNACGDRCTAFCDVVLDTCTPDAGPVPYPSKPECASACANFTYHDAGTDGGGEGPAGPDGGDSLNCRLFYLRAATLDPNKCSALPPDSGACGP